MHAIAKAQCSWCMRHALAFATYFATRLKFVIFGPESLGELTAFPKPLSLTGIRTPHSISLDPSDFTFRLPRGPRSTPDLVPHFLDLRQKSITIVSLIKFCHACDCMAAMFYVMVLIIITDMNLSNLSIIKQLGISSECK